MTKQASDSEDKYVKWRLGQYPMLIKVRYVEIWAIQ